MPPKLNVFTEDRNTLLKYIQFAWKANYMRENQKMCEIPVYRSQITVNDE